MTATDNYDSYLGDSGIFTDYEGTVTDAYFGTWEKARDQEAIFLYLTFKTDSPDRPEHTERYGCGAGWVTNDGGETVVNDRGARKFHKRFSTYQSAWLDHAIPLLKDAGVLDEFIARGPSTQASVWNGTRWQIGEKVESYPAWDAENKRQMKDEKGNVVLRESRYNVPVAFLGFEGDARSNGKGSAADLSFLPADLRARLSEVARESANRDIFLNKVMLDVPEVQQNGLTGEVAKSSVYESLRAG